MTQPRPPATPDEGVTSARRRFTVLILGGLLTLWTVSAALFTIDATEAGLVTRFGRIVQVVEVPGLHLKLPFDRVVPVDRRLLYSKPAEAEYLTLDKKNVVIRSLIIWQIADPKRFLETVETRANAEIQLADVVLAEIGAALGDYPFASFVSSNVQVNRFRSLIAEVRDSVGAYTLPAFGIDVVQVELRQLSLPEQNRQSVFERMKAERGKIAKQYRSEGERDANQMMAEADGEKTRIMAEVYKEAARVKAEGDAEATRIYADAFGKNAPFYRFLRTLQAYETILDNRTTLFLPANAEVLEILQDAGLAAGGPSLRPSSPAPTADDRAADALGDSGDAR